MLRFLRVGRPDGPGTLLGEGNKGFIRIDCVLVIVGLGRVRWYANHKANSVPPAIPTRFAILRFLETTGVLGCTATGFFFDFMYILYIYFSLALEILYVYYIYRDVQTSHPMSMFPVLRLWRKGFIRRRSRIRSPERHRSSTRTRLFSCSIQRILPTCIWNIRLRKIPYRYVLF